MKEILSLALLNDWATGVAVEKGITPLKVATPHQSTGVAVKFGCCRVKFD